MRKVFSLVVILIFICGIFVFEAKALTEDEKIDYLISCASQLEGKFIRNGKEHTPAEGVTHIQRKRKYFFRFRKPDVKIFIEKVAFGSWKTKMPYIWRDTNGREHLLQDVLAEKLKELENNGERLKI